MFELKTYKNLHSCVGCLTMGIDGRPSVSRAQHSERYVDWVGSFVWKFHNAPPFRDCVVLVTAKICVGSHESRKLLERSKLSAFIGATGKLKFSCTGSAS